jgi:hypothetical protein
MSTDQKPVTMRLIVPQTASTRVLTILGLGAKVEAKDLVLKTRGLTTADMVRHIKEYSKVRDEMSQVFRQTGITREGKPVIPELSNLDAMMREDQTQLEDIRSKYQRMQSETESLQREVEGVKKQIASVDQLSETGFSYEEMSSQLAGFRRILGKLPAKKLEPAQKALRALLKDRTIVATGARKQDWVYLLVASPTDAATQALQTLVLYDFISIDIPSLEGGSFTETVQSWRDRRDTITGRIGEREAEVKTLSGGWADSLNRLTDGIQEIILTLRSVLKLGEGTSVTHIFVRLEEPPPQETLASLARDGILEVESY